jgi:hypothetical protein
MIRSSLKNLAENIRLYEAVTCVFELSQASIMAHGDENSYSQVLSKQGFDAPKDKSEMPD